MSERTSSAWLAERRRLRRRRGLIAFIILLLLLLAGAVWGIWQNPVRISRVEINNADARIVEIARQAMRGNYFGIIPRDSIFFFPEERIRANILAAHLDIAAVSIFRNDFFSISIKTDYRVPIARWCVASTTDCYLFDTKGFIFSTTSPISLVNSFSVYEPIADGTTTSPIGLTLPNAGKLPAAFDFARQLNTFGSSVSAIIFRNDEVDDYLASGTRVTYLLGSEENAFTALMSAKANFNLADGSVEYIDLRFDGKVYLKKK